MTGRKLYLACIAIMILIGMGNFPLMAWENTITIAAGGNTYEKPEVRIGPSGMVYISYRNKGSNSDIYLCTYDGKELKYENASEMHTRWSSYKCYEADIHVDADERLHVTWIAHPKSNADTHYIMYRYKEEGTWSQLYELASLDMHGGDVAFDTRIGVSNNGNVHVVTYKEHDKSTWYVAKYGDTIIPSRKVGPPNGWNKHPDIAVNDDFVYVMWQQKQGFPYVQMIQKWENKMGGAMFGIDQVTTPKEPYASQKGRIALDANGVLHFVDFYKTGTVKNLYFYEGNGNGTYKPEINVSNKNKMALYHWAALEIKGNSVFTSVQLGSTKGGNGVFWNWRKNGVWSGYALIPGTGGAVHQSADLTADGEIAAVAYGVNNNSVYLVTSAPITVTGQLEAKFTFPGNVFAGADVTFDASEVAALNPDYSIAQYDWDFGDGTTQTTTSPTIAHNFQHYNTTVKVQLTITATTGEQGLITQDVAVKALYSNNVINIVNKQIRTLFWKRGANELTWVANPKNTANNFPAIVRYEIWRASVHTSMNESDYVKVGEVDSGVTIFVDFYGLKGSSSFGYAIRSVDTEGHISPINNL